MQRIWRIKDLLEWTTRYFLDKGIAESRLEAEILLAHVVQKDRVYLYANYEEPVNNGEREIYREYIKRRIKGEPLAYITGHKEFMSLDFKVSPEVLIPRPDTEVLVETVLALAREENIKRIIDVGTGSGAIAVSLAVYMAEVEVLATDISPYALDIARKNAQHHRADIKFIQGNLLEALCNEQNAQLACCANQTCTQHSETQESQWGLAGSVNELGNNDPQAEIIHENHPLVSFDMITANLPYIPSREIEQVDRQVKDFEPHLALFATGDGLDLYRQLIPQAYALLRPAGIVLIEIDPRQVPAVLDIMSGFTDIKIIRDYAGRERVVQARRENNA